MATTSSYSFKERFRNTVNYMKGYWRAQNIHPDEYGLIQRTWPETPSPTELFRRISYFFVNANEVLDLGRPISSKVKFIAGIQIKDEQGALKLDAVRFSMLT